MKPLVSVVLPTRSRSAKFRRAIMSVLDQTYNNLEIIVVDGSNDEYVREIVAEIDPPVPVKLEHDTGARGVSAARNIGITAAEGSYIAFIDDDDEWRQSKITKQVKILENSIEAGVVYTGNRKLDSDGNIRSISTPNAEGDVTRQLLFGSLFGTFSALAMDRNLVSEVGLLDESLRAREDWDYYLRLSCVTEFHSIEEPLVTKYTGDYNQLSDNFEHIKQGSLRLLQKHQSLAKKHGEWQKMNSRIRYGLGYSAAMRGDYWNARRFFAAGIWWYPWSFENYFWLGLVSGGGLTLKPAQCIKRSVVRISYKLSYPTFRE